MDSKKHLLIGAVVGAGLLLLYGPGVLRWLELRQQETHLESEITSLETENRRLYEEARRLREDPDYAEAVARRELGYVRPGETKIHFKNTKEASSKQSLR